MKLPFNKPYMTGKELSFIEEAHNQGHLAGDGAFTKRCHEWLQDSTGCRKALLTHSCTAALEMSALLLDLKPGDEVIMPSFTFVSTANAFVLRGATPVFVDIRKDTMNIDESKIEEAITSRTKAICVVHYAGVGCEMNTILEVAKRHGLAVVEDAAQGIMSSYRGKPLGSFGVFGTLSFHETKNVISGEGGALLVNDERYIERAEIIREKGTNRSKFFRGQIDKYTWVDAGSSYLPSELTAAFLAAQLEEARSITDRRLALWERYYEWAEVHEQAGIVQRPFVPKHCVHNAHMFYLLLPSLGHRTRFIQYLREHDIHAVFHYIPLHTAPAGQHYGRAMDDMRVTEEVSNRLVRLPFWLGLEDHLDRVLECAARALQQSA
jgi:dTDP-4-amino-4,6-dideoxygalactose transaminase